MIINSGNGTTDGGSNTNDKIFLLSSAEALKYFDSDVERKCTLTAYAHDHQGATQNMESPLNGKATAWWWSSYTASYVSNFGVVNLAGYAVDENPGGLYIAVRPTLWINLDVLTSQ